jgi:uncharacterized protein (TIGR00730 family)
VTVAAVCVFCASSTSLDPRWLELAREVGAELARRGHRLVSGGGRVGMMGTVTAGARSAGAHTLGIMPASMITEEIADADSDEFVVTDGMAARKTVMVERSDAFLVLPGGLGTLDELFEVWTTGMLGLHGKPVVLLNVEGFYTPLLDWIHSLVPAGFVRAGSFDSLVIAHTVAEAVDAVEGCRTPVV